MMDRKVGNKRGEPRMAEIRFDKDRLAEAMKRQGFSDYTLAKKTGISRTAIYYLRIGKRTQPSAETVKRLAEGLGTTVEHFMGIDEPKLTASPKMPVAIQQLADIAGNLSEVRQEELIRIATALQKLEQEQQTLTTPQVTALMELHEKLREQGVGEDVLNLLESLLPPPRRVIHLRRRQRSHKPGE